MFRKLTTIVDCKLAREIEKDPESEVCSSEGFKVCMQLAPSVVYRGLNLTLGRRVLLGKESEADTGPSSDNNKVLEKFFGSEGYCLRHEIQAAHRIEAVIHLESGATSFRWLLLLFGKSEKEPFYGLSMDVGLDGRISRLHLTNMKQ